MNRKEFVIVTWGGIGDALICTPTMKALKETYPDYKIVLYCINQQHKDVFKNNYFVDSLRLLKIGAMLRYPYHLFAYLFRKDLVRYINLQFQHIPLSWVYSKSVVEIVPEIFGVKLKDKNIQLFFTEKEQHHVAKMIQPYKDVIFMHITSRSSANHNWKTERWIELVKQMPEFTFIQLGHKDEPAVTGAVDWRGKTTLRESLCLIQYGLSFVGVESSLGHVTNAFGIPGVVLFGDSSPVHWGHDNNINIFKGLPCSPCFYYSWGDPCPYGHECMNFITVKEVREALLQQVLVAKSRC